MKANRAILTLLASCLALAIPTYAQTAPQGSSAAAAVSRIVSDWSQISQGIHDAYQWVKESVPH